MLRKVFLGSRCFSPGKNALIVACDLPHVKRSQKQLLSPHVRANEKEHFSCLYAQYLLMLTTYTHRTVNSVI